MTGLISTKFIYDGPVAKAEKGPPGPVTLLMGDGLYVTKSESTEDFIRKWGLVYLGFLKGASFRVQQTAVGLVDMFGKVYEHERGYRAEGIIMRQLTLLTNGRKYTSKFIASMERRFQCDVTQLVLPREMRYDVMKKYGA